MALQNRIIKKPYVKNHNCKQTLTQTQALPNRAVQLTPLARLVGWARFTRQNAPACWRPENPQPPGRRDTPTRPAIYRSAARALPSSCLFSLSSTLHTPASGAADSCTLGCTLRAPPCLTIGATIHCRSEKVKTT